MLFSKKGLEYLARHAERRDNGSWRCKKTGAQIEFRAIEQLVEDEVPGRTKNKQVRHVFCRACTIQPEFPSPGDRIRASDLAPMGMGL